MAHSINLTRRMLLKTGVALGLMPGVAFAQSGGSIKIGSLTPLTGSGASYGGRMRDAIAAVIGAVNEVGGLDGRQLVLVSEDDQTSPESGVRAARKLIDVDQVVAIAGVWASSVTTAIAPLCWESKTMLLCTSAANSITLLPHHGYIVRTEPGSTLWMEKIVSFMLGEGARKVAYMGLQTPFAEFAAGYMEKAALKAGGSSATSIYGPDKTSYRSEVDQILATSPEFIYLGGYSTDTIVVLRDLFRAGYRGKILTQNYTVDQTLLDALPTEVTDGVFSVGTATPDASVGFQAAKALLKTDQIDPYVAQAYDHANLVILALAASSTKNGEGIRNKIRDVSQGEGTKVGSAVEGIKLLAEGKSVNYEGASGDLTFNEIGDITTFPARFDLIKIKKFEQYKTL
ncbi:amino acid ABC transporter substrate-binding protein [Mesorhizobium sp. M8A.F.Ca.ET.173.01.1.1]|nr:amino acid ABC transporter substrate-binding protein [Mesorhizobium sp. M8A.F.Ca.ET.173.01.1.1]